MYRHKQKLQRGRKDPREDASDKRRRRWTVEDKHQTHPQQRTWRLRKRTTGSNGRIEKGLGTLTIDLWGTMGGIRISVIVELVEGR